MKNKGGGRKAKRAQMEDMREKPGIIERGHGGIEKMQN
jgi:hypothetical protein